MYSQLHKCWKITHVIIGPPDVGKTELFQYYNTAQFADEKDQKQNKKTISTQTSKFSNGYSNGSRPRNTVGMDFGMRKLEIDAQAVTLDIWDTAGQDKYETITNSYFRRADIIWIVLDLTDDDGIDSLKRYWIPRAFEYATKPHVQAILIGNKYDIIEKLLDDDNEYDEIRLKYEDIIKPKVKRLIKKWQLPYFEISAKTGWTSIEDCTLIELFVNVTTAFLRNLVQEQIKRDKKNGKKGKRKDKKSKRKGKKRYYQQYDDYSREKSITLDSKDYDFSKPPNFKEKSGGCCTML